MSSKQKQRFCSIHEKESDDEGGAEDDSHKYIALCLSCRSLLCVDCLFEHPCKNYVQLSKLRQEWVENMSQLLQGAKNKFNYFIDVNKQHSVA